jgi:hypothetical protein
VGIGFDSLQLLVVDEVDESTRLSQTFSSLTAAETFFKEGNSISLGAISAGSQSIEIDFLLSYWDSPSITPNASFGFTYALVDPPALNAPEPSTWAMLLLGFAGYRRTKAGSAGLAA